MAWNDLTLATDADLSAYEPEMPDAAKRAGQSGQTPYDGKRAIAKRDIEARLRRMGIDPDQIADASELTTAAVFAELHYIYRAMGRKNETVDIEKSDYYWRRFDDEMASPVLTLTTNQEADTFVRQVQVSRG